MASDDDEYELCEFCGMRPETDYCRECGYPSCWVCLSGEYLCELCQQEEANAKGASDGEGK